MKTTLTFALAFAIQTIANGQTPCNHMIRMELSTTSIETVEPQATTAGKLLDEEQQLQQLKDEVNAAQKKLIQKHVAISRIRSYMAYDLFASNNLMIAQLIANPSLKEATIEKSQGLNSLAAQEIKLAKEIREEADAQATPEAQLAELSNAEEKETLALAKQQEAIKLLKLGAPLFIKQNSAEFTSQTIIAKSPAKEISIDALRGLTQQANDMKNTYEQLRAVAAGKTGNEKAAMLNEALSMEQEYIAARIQISLKKYQHSEKTYRENKAFIMLLLEGIGDDALTTKARLLSDDADYNFRLGKEMREEANAQFTEAARYGEMSNAEEKELLALSQQQQSVNELKKLNRGLLLASN
jgi:hypothetical protein